MGLICAWECHRKARKAGAGPVVHPAPWLTHYPSCPFILPNLARGGDPGQFRPRLGAVDPTDNYAHLPAVGKWLLSLSMLLRRLEIFTMIVLFSPDA